MKISNQIICPVSSGSVSLGVVRITALFTFLGYFFFLFNPFWLLPLFFSVDFYIRGFTNRKYSPLSWLSNKINEQAGYIREKTNKAPKIFAARIGFFLSVLVATAIVLNWWTTAVIIASVIALFAFLEAVFNFCMGCYVYTYLIVPLFMNDKKNLPA